MNELISIIMCVYNENINELRESVFSIINQTYKNIEIIIVNDNPGSEETADFLRELQDERIVIIENEENSGLIISLNRALSKTRGNYIARMDADDIAMPGRLEDQITYLKSNEKDMAGCCISLIDEDGNIIRETVRFPEKNEDIKHFIKWGNCIPHPTWLVKKEVYDRLGGYRQVPHCEDYDFVLRAIRSGDFNLGNAPFVGMKYRLRTNSVSAQYEGEQFVLRRYLAKHRQDIDRLTEEEISDHIRSKEYDRELKRYNKYKEKKEEFKRDKSLCVLPEILFNKFFYICKYENYQLEKREKTV